MYNISATLQIKTTGYRDMIDRMIAQHEHLIQDCQNSSGLIRINNTIIIVINSELSQSEKITEFARLLNQI